MFSDFCYFELLRPPPVEDHFYLHAGWSPTEGSTVLVKNRLYILGYLATFLTFYVKIYRIQILLKSRFYFFSIVFKVAGDS